MGILYLAALVIGGGTLALQLLLGGNSDADAEAHAGIGEVHGDTDTGDGHDTHAHADGGFLPIFLSLRFWVYGLLGFGMVGAGLHYLGLASSLVTPLIAAAVGLLSGFVASWIFRALARADTSSGAEAADAVGQVGRVLVPCTRERKGKVRIEVRGQTLDLIASTDDMELVSGSEVLVEEMRGMTAHVSRAPADFLPGKR